MTPARMFYTATMAKVHADQGNLKKAIEIYRYLLEKEPERQDLKIALTESEKRWRAQMIKGAEGLVPLVGEWIDLAFRCSRIERLRTFKAILAREKPPFEQVSNG